MSEYQYYEFLALDRPLTAKQLRLGRVWVHDPVRRDAESLVSDFLPVQVDESGAG